MENASQAWGVPAAAGMANRGVCPVTEVSVLPLTDPAASHFWLTSLFPSPSLYPHTAACESHYNQHPFDSSEQL